MLCLLAASGCARPQESSPVIAVVNDREIRRADFERFLALKMGELSASDTPDPLRSQMLDEYLRRRLVIDEAARAGLTVTKRRSSKPLKIIPN